jgi:hypothetical protein
MITQEKVAELTKLLRQSLNSDINLNDQLAVPIYRLLKDMFLDEQSARALIIEILKELLGSNFLLSAGGDRILTAAQDRLTWRPDQIETQVEQQ